MYSVVMDMTGAGGHKALVHQLVVVSTLGEVAASTPSGKTDLGDMYKRLFEELQEGRQWVSFSGMLLVYQKYCLQVIESPPDMIREVAAAIARMNADGILGTTKILWVLPSTTHRRAIPRVPPCLLQCLLDEGGTT
jgi:hypothetical protein